MDLYIENYYKSNLYDHLIPGGEFKLFEVGGKNNDYLTVCPTFVNVIKSKIFYNCKTKYELKKIQPSTDPIIFGTLLDIKNVLFKLNKEKLSKDDIIKYIFSYDAIPLMFKYKDDNTIYKNKKKSFFSKDSKLILVTFKINKSTELYYENIEESPKDVFVSECNKKKNFIVAHYIFENYYMLVTRPKELLKPDMFYVVNIEGDNKFCFKEFTKDLNLKEFNDRKLSLEEITNIINKSLDYLSYLKIPVSM